VCVCVRACVRVCVRTCMYDCAWLWVSVFECLSVYICVWSRVRERKSVCVCVMCVLCACYVRVYCVRVVCVVCACYVRIRRTSRGSFLFDRRSRLEPSQRRTRGPQRSRQYRHGRGGTNTGCWEMRCERQGQLESVRLFVGCLAWKTKGQGSAEQGISYI